MKTVFSPETIRQVIDFHGHQCPGLAIGIRVSEYARSLFPKTSGADLFCVAETDMCGVDAVQFLTGCTFGKGNLVHLDHGKMAFSFFDLPGNSGVRLKLKSDRAQGEADEMAELMEAQANGTLSASMKKRLAELRSEREQQIMSSPLTELFEVQDVNSRPPRPARILRSLACDSCAENTMESRTRRFAGQTLCIPCFKAVEQKV